MKTDRIWSTWRIGPGRHSYASIRFFKTAQGQLGQGFAYALGPSETNLKEAGRFFALLEPELVSHGQTRLWGLQVTGLPDSFQEHVVVCLSTYSTEIELQDASKYLFPSAVHVGPNAPPVFLYEHTTVTILLKFGQVPVLLHTIEVTVTLFFSDVSDPLLQLAEVKGGRTVAVS